MSSKDFTSTDANKGAPNEIPFIYREIFRKLKENCDPNGRIPFASARYILGSCFHVKRRDSFAVMIEMKHYNLLKIRSYNYIQLSITPEKKLEAML